jgi:hypothetical protein
VTSLHDGDRLREAAQRLYDRLSVSVSGAPMQDDIKALGEALAAASSPEPGLQEAADPVSEPCRWMRGLDYWTSCRTHGWSGSYDERVRVGHRLFCPLALRGATP